MQTRAVLWDHVRTHDLCPGAESLDQWMNVRWIRVRIRGRAIPVLPVIGYRESLILHDVHHVLTGYSTRFKGELELAAWELASGGCGRHLLFWPDRALAVAIGLVVCPKRIHGAALRGRRCRNLYKRRSVEVLASEIEELRLATGV